MCFPASDICKYLPNVFAAQPRNRLNSKTNRSTTDVKKDRRDFGCMLWQKETFFIGQKETWLNPIWVSISINQHQSAIISIKQPKEKIFFMVSHVLYVSFRGISKRRRCMLNISFDCKHIWKNFDILNEGKPIRRKFNNRILTYSFNLLQNFISPTTNIQWVQRKWRTCLGKGSSLSGTRKSSH